MNVHRHPSRSLRRGGARPLPRTRALALVVAVALGACAGDGGAQDDAVADAPTTDGAEDEADAQSSADAGEDGAAGDESPMGEDGVWFSVDEGAGTIAIDDPNGSETVAITGTAVLAIDGAEHRFTMLGSCPVPGSGDPADVTPFRGVGFDPDGVAMNLNANSPEFGLNTTYEADWRSTTTAHDWFGVDWQVDADQLTASTDGIKVVDTGDRAAATITVTCS